MSDFGDITVPAIQLSVLAGLAMILGLVIGTRHFDQFSSHPRWSSVQFHIYLMATGTGVMVAAFVLAMMVSRYYLAVSVLGGVVYGISYGTVRRLDPEHFP